MAWLSLPKRWPPRLPRQRQRKPIEASLSLRGALGAGVCFSWHTLKIERRNQPPTLSPGWREMGQYALPSELLLALTHSNCRNVPTRFLPRVQGQQGELHPPQPISIRGHLRHLWVLVVLGEAGKCPRKRKKGCSPEARNC